MDIPTSDTLVVPPGVNSRDLDDLLREENNVASIRPFQLKHAKDLNDGPLVSFGSLELLINGWKCGMGD
jgi:hypothetical protein